MKCFATSSNVSRLNALQSNQHVKRHAVEAAHVVSTHVVSTHVVSAHVVSTHVVSRHVVSIHTTVFQSQTTWLVHRPRGFHTRGSTQTTCLDSTQTTSEKHVEIA